MALYVVCFDITDDAIRTRVGKRLLQLGDRVQESVFEVHLPGTGARIALAAELRPLLEPGDDLRFYRLCLDCRRASHDHRGEPIATLPSVIIL
jgi:CRISPR-associated endonuclease Cas2